jgi:hypothetical protein
MGRPSPMTISSPVPTRDAADAFWRVINRELPVPTDLCSDMRPAPAEFLEHRNWQHVGSMHERPVEMPHPHADEWAPLNLPTLESLPDIAARLSSRALGTSGNQPQPPQPQPAPPEPWVQERPLPRCSTPSLR